jgi:hypothetical protein
MLAMPPALSMPESSPGAPAARGAAVHFLPPAFAMTILTSPDLAQRALS